MRQFAFILDGLPSDWMFVRLVLLCVGAPIISALLSGILLRKKMVGVLLAAAVAGLAQWSILSARESLISWGYPYVPTWPVTVLPLIAACLPFAALLIVIHRQEKEPNQPLQPTRPFGPRG